MGILGKTRKEGVLWGHNNQALFFIFPFVYILVKIVGVTQKVDLIIQNILLIDFFMCSKFLLMCCFC